jgi:(S)-3,5-dihydroxyphenylglycine transaminase
MQSATNGSVVGFLNEIAVQFPSAVFFAAGAPSGDFLSRLDLPVIQSALQSYARHVSSGRAGAGTLAGLMQYGPTSGLINDIVAEHMRIDDGLAATGEQVLITAGCQEALALCLPELCREPTDILLVCNPTYIGAIGAARSHRIEVAGISLSDGDLAGQIEARAEAARARGRRVRALYLMPTFDNPSGLVLGREERYAILDVCARERIVILEDNPYGMFDYDGSALAPIAQEDRNGCVIYLSTYSKTLAPSLRIGAATLPQTLFGNLDARRELMARLVERKGLLTLNTAQMNQAIVGGMLLQHGFSLREWIAPAHASYRANRDALIGQLESDFAGYGDRVRWTRPGGGFFVSLTLPFAFGLDDALHCARNHSVIAMPMRFFALDSSQNRSLRLAFSSVTPEQARAGVRGLAHYVEATLANGCASALSAPTL